MYTDEARAKRRDRRMIAAGELSARQIAALQDAKVPDQHVDLDRELKNWKPLASRTGQ